MTVSRSPCDWSDSTAAYLLGALDEDERRAFEAHLDGCATCRGELADLSPAVEVLAAQVERIAPPARLRATLMAEVNAEAELRRAAGPQADTHAAPARPRPRWQRTLRVPLAAAAAAATLLIAVGVVGGALIAGDHERAPRVIAAQVVRGFAPNARAELVVGPDFARLALRGMPQPPAGKVYQVWLMVPGKRRPQPTDVLFSTRQGGTATVAVPIGHPRAREVLVTAEPRGGSSQPTSAPVVAARLA